MGVHAALSALGSQWDRAVGFASYGVRQRLIAAVAALREEGWPVLGSPARRRLGELTLGWDAVGQ